jgi:para-aminobenzoate synthetase
MRQTVRSLVFLVLFVVVLETFAWVRSPLISRKAVPSSTTRQLQWASSSSLGMTRDDNVQIDAQADNNDPANKLDLKLLLLDHYDSFTYNLADMLAQICTRPPIVLAADSCRSWAELQETYDLYDLDGIILSPGPGNPVSNGKLSIDICRECPDVPILGVCLGHQILGHVYGATVDTAPVPIHGQVRPILQLVHKDGDGDSDEEDALWKNIPTELLVTRYHSLAVQLNNSSSQSPSPLIPTAVSPEDGVLMAMRHFENPHFGVQFHPESIGTVHGKQLVRNFCDVCDEHTRSNPSRRQRRSADESQSTNTITTPAEQQQQQQQQKQPPFTVYMHKVVPTTGTTMRPDQVMQSFLAQHTHTFWLDHAFADGQSAAISILGASDQGLEYWGPEKQPRDCQGLFQWKHDAASKTTTPVANVKKLDTDILTHLQDEHCHATDAVTLVEFGGDDGGDDDAGNVRLNRLLEDELEDILPFDYRGGHVGYLGYEVRHDTARYLEEQEHGQHRETMKGRDGFQGSSNPKIPTAAFLWADKSFVYDHQGGEWYLVGVAPTDESPDSTIDWLRSTSKTMQEWSGLNGTNGSTASTEDTAGEALVSVPIFTPNRPRETYNRNFDECIEQIRLGESYELCLTNQLEANVRVPGSSPLELYNVLRRRNPAPFSAFLNWNSQSTSPPPETGTDAAVALCCSSPERFISVKRKRKQLNSGAKDGTASYKLEVEAKPIKGTCARVIPANGRTRTASEEAEDVERAQTLQSSLKNRAENLMIVDLLRNDLSRVCQTGSVHVAKLMDIESYATVHQMVSTIRGALDPTKACSIDVLKACFPGGSMTGAPKLRTMELIDAMEEGVSRGPYSGCLGYISLNGSMDMNIVIRTAVLTPADGRDAWNISIGAGGAITALSESTDEYEEMILKSSAVVGAVQEWACSSESTPENATKHISDSKIAVEGKLLDTKRV